jgi:hypothetical protein
LTVDARSGLPLKKPSSSAHTLDSIGVNASDDTDPAPIDQSCDSPGPMVPMFTPARPTNTATSSSVHAVVLWTVPRASLSAPDEAVISSAPSTLTAPLPVTTPN